MATSSKVPASPPGRLTCDPGDVLSFTDPLWRIHRTSGPHVAPWSSPRRFGPLSSMRFDPHPDGPPTLHADTGVLYNATDIATAVAEVFQRARVVDTTSGSPNLVGWRPTRPLRLLDLTGTWALRNGAAFALVTAPRSVCRSWARAIHDRFELDGLYASSTMTGAANVVLWHRSVDAVPAAPEFSRPLAHPITWSLLARAARDIGYGLI